jgi:hypothetical protein
MKSPAGQNSNATTGQILNYGVEPFHRRWRAWRVLLVVLVAGGIAAVVWPMIHPFVNQAEFLAWQSRMSHQALAAGTVIYTEDPVRVGVLKNDPAYRPKQQPWPADFPAPSAVERIWHTMDWEVFAPSGRIRVQSDDTFSFERTSAGGQHWIIHLDQVNPWASDKSKRYVGFTQGAVRPAGWTPGTRGAWVSYDSRQVLLSPNDVITLFAPQPDPSNAAQILVPYELNGTPGTIIGTVKDNGGVHFSVKNGPAQVVNPKF